LTESSCGKFGGRRKRGEEKKEKKKYSKKVVFLRKSQKLHQDLMIFPGKMMHSSLFSVFRVSI
jgi:hypothetical protein